MDRIEIKVECSALLRKTAFADRQEQIRTKAAVMTEIEDSINMW
jgi:hypothetical protein